MKKSNADLYDPYFVKGMFDRMSKTYGFANLVTSFGFTSRWRRQCIADLPTIQVSAQGFDFMSGMGESWTGIQKRINPSGRIIALDISDEMNRKAAEHLNRLKTKNVKIVRTNVLQNHIPSHSADFVVSTFGIKTFDEEQQKILAIEIARILKPAGSFAFIEISVPQFRVLSCIFMFYLKIIIPLIARIFLGNSEDYRMLGTYCANFKNSMFFHEQLIERGLKSNYKTYFFGCATGVYGVK